MLYGLVYCTVEKTDQGARPLFIILRLGTVESKKM